MKKILLRLICCLLIAATVVFAAACENGKRETKKPQKSTVSVIDNDSSDDTQSDNDTQSDTDDPAPRGDNAGVNDTTGRVSPIKNNNSSRNNGSESDDELDLTVDENDKAFSDNPAALYRPMKSYFDSQANAVRTAVRAYPDKLPSSVTGQIWYISSENGNDGKSGKSKDKAWRSITALNYYANDIKAGDAVLFERGGVYRGNFIAKSGVYYGAYGSGDKPCIYGSSVNYAKASWKRKHGNIWYCEALFQADIGVIVFDHGVFIGSKQINNYDIENIGDFWCDSKSNYRLYVCMDENPSKKYRSIEIGTKKDIISIPKKSKDITIENLCIKYTGGHGIASSGDVSNITVRGCEIGFIGGSYLSGTTRYGNGIEIYEGCAGVLCENNWIYQIYDSGLTYQGGGEHIYTDVTFRNNLIEYCGMGSIEYWLSGDKAINYAENVTYESNILRFAGYSWGGEQRPDKCSTNIRSDTTCMNTHYNFRVTGNIFDQSAVNLLEINGTSGTFPEMLGNIYAQSRDGLLGVFKDKNSMTFDEDIEEFLKAFVDKNAKAYIY